MAFPTGPQWDSLETENPGRAVTRAQRSPLLAGYGETPRALALGILRQPDGRGKSAPKIRLPKRTSFRSHRGAPPEVWFRILHIAPDSRNTFTEADLVEQTVEVALGPKEAFENGTVGTLKRCVTADRVVNAAAKARRPAKLPRQPRTPRVVELLRKAHEWRRQLDAGEVPTQADIARREGVTRARVTQVMGLLRLMPEIQEHVLSVPDMVSRPLITERALRPIAQLETPDTQRTRFRELLLLTVAGRPRSTP